MQKKLNNSFSQKNILQQQVSVTPSEGEAFRFSGPLLRRMTAEQAWDSIVLLLRGPEVDAIRTDHAPRMERLVFPFEITHDRKGIVQDREKIFAFARSLLGDRKASNGAGGRRLFLRTPKSRRANAWLRASELRQPTPPTHFLRIAGQSAREVADDGSTEGGITESLAMMNGEITEALMTKSAVLKGTRRNRTEAEQIEFLYQAFFLRQPDQQDKKRCVAALAQGLELGDIIWALLNSREFIFIQ